MALAPLVLWKNIVRSAASTITGLSESNALPFAFLRDQLPSKPWRSMLGWNVRAGLNGVLDFSEGTAKRVAYLPDGNHPTHAGYAAAVTAAMNNAGQLPSTIASVSGWYRPESLAALADGAEVAQWDDESGNNRHLTQATPSLRPLLSRAVVNGRHALRFDGTGLTLLSAVDIADFLGAAGIGTVFVVFRSDEDVAGSDVLWSAGASNEIAQYVGSAALVAKAFDGTIDEATKPTTPGAWHIGLWIKTATDVHCGHDDADFAALAITPSGASTALANPLRVGGTAGSGTALKGYVAEIVAFNDVLSAESRVRASRYLAQKYGIADASAAPVWGNTYAASWDQDTRLFTLARTAGSDTFDLLHTSGAHALQSASRDLGFGTPGEVPADQTGATSYVAARAAEHGREWVDIEYLGTDVAQAFIMLAHNIDTPSADRVVSIRGSDVPVFASTPLFRVDLEDEGAFLMALQEAPETVRYWRLEIDDIGNEDGFSEVGVLYIGPVETMAKVLSQYEDTREELSEIAYALEGAHYVTERPTRRAWAVSFVVTGTGKLMLEELAAAVKTGGDFFFIWNPEDLAQTRYVFLDRGISFRALETFPLLWRVQMTLIEALA